MPLHYSAWQLNAPIRIASDLTVEHVEGLLLPDNFDLWRDYISKKDRDDLSSTTMGVVHRFFQKNNTPAHYLREMV